MPLGLKRVDSVRDAAVILAADASARYLAGGTLLMRAVNRDDGAIGALVVADHAGLGRIEVGGGRVTLGAAVTMAQVAGHPELGFLAPVAGSIGGPAVRNMATVGGNLFARAPYGDFAVALLALGATVTLESAAGSDKKVAELWARMTHNRRFGARWAAETLLQKPGVRPDLTLDEAQRTFTIAIDWATYRTLHGELGLSHHQLQEWMRSYYQHMFLSQPPNTQKRST